jgi:hypothetical protein
MSERSAVLSIDELVPEPPFEPGIWVHFKGSRYLALWLSRSSENRNAFFVEYFSLETGMHWSRPYASPEGLPDHERAGWTDVVEREGYRGPRFRKVEVSPAILFDALALAIPQPLWSVLRPYGPEVTGSFVRRGQLFDEGKPAPFGPYEEGR